MKLRRIDIQGFKSFRDRTSIDLADGMTSIVGPNGCGKSNVVDAIKWAMGDMSAKNLRGDAMSDLIFAGSETHKPAGLAEVTLTFENTPTAPKEDNTGAGEEGAEDESAEEAAEAEFGAVPWEYRNMTEIAVTRRLHRSGESEYLINKTACRLMDIRDLLAGTGVGQQGYSIIEQNRVGFIVAAKPSERRLIIEEASGITRYKTQRDRTERRLVRSEENLQRVDDILREVQKQIRSLERQAQRAVEHRQLSAELRALEIALLLERRAELLEQGREHAEKLRKTTEKLQGARGEVKALEDALNSAKVEQFQWEKAHSERTEAYYRLDTRLNLAKSRVEHAEASIAEARQRLEKSRREAQAQASRKEQLQAELEEVRAAVAAFDADEALQTDLDGREEEARELREALRQAERDRDQTRQRAGQKANELRRIADRRAWMKTRREELAQREAALSASLAEGEAEIEELEAAVEAAAEAHEALTKQAGELEAAQSGTAGVLQEKRTKLAELERRLRETKSARIDLETRAESLRATLARGEGYGQGVKKVLAWAKEQGRDDVLGPFGDFLEVDADDERRVASFLGDRIGDLVVASRQAAMEALDALKASKVKGRVSFWIAGTKQRAEVRARAEQIVARLHVAEALDEVPTTIELDAAWALPDEVIVFGDDRLVGGDAGDGAEALLRQRRTLREVEVSLEEKRRQDEALSAEAHEARKSLDAMEEEARQERSQLEAARLELRAKAQELSGKTREAQRARQSLERSRAQLVPVFKAKDELDREASDFDADEAGLRAEVDELRGEVGAKTAALEELKEKLEVLQSEMTAEKVRLAEARERHRSLLASRARLEQALRSTDELIDKYRREAQEQEVRAAELESTIATSRGDAEGAGEELEESRAAMEEARRKLAEANARLDEIEARMRGRRQSVESLSSESQSLELAARDSELGVAHVDEQLLERFELEPLAAKEAAKGVDTPKEGRKGRRDYLRARLDKLGPVNAMAEEEFAEAGEREAFLADQKADLEAAIDDLRQAIARMDRESKRRFRETFDAVNAKFQEIFPRLFRGGKAQLLLTDPDDMLATGVDIQVQPPGKRLQNVSLLSGGEKALTAVSLIFSIFLLKPTPFSILDEVDAPLDEANVGRFAEMVREMSRSKSQMIVITHSRRTMECADVLYGVTMEQPGVSKMVSVRLSELDDSIAS